MGLLLFTVFTTAIMKDYIFHLRKEKQKMRNSDNVDKWLGILAGVLTIFGGLFAAARTGREVKRLSDELKLEQKKLEREEDEEE